MSMLTTNAVARNATRNDGITRLCLRRGTIGATRNCCLPVLTFRLWIGLEVRLWMAGLWMVGLSIGLNKTGVTFILTQKLSMIAIDIDFVTCRLQSAQQKKFRYETILLRTTRALAIACIVHLITT